LKIACEGHEPSVFCAIQSPSSSTVATTVLRIALNCISMSDSNRYVPQHRRQGHKGKNQFRGEELRRRREDQQVEIRKQKKEENIAKRRNLEITNVECDDSWEVASDLDLSSEPDDDDGDEPKDSEVSVAYSHQNQRDKLAFCFTVLSADRIGCG
jgi:hypothetical protein